MIGISVGLLLGLALMVGFLWHIKRKYTQDVHKQTSDGSNLICKQVNSKHSKPDGTADSIKTVDGVGIAHGIETVDDIKTAGSVEIVDGDGTADDIGTIDGIGTEDSNGKVEDGTADSIKTVDGVGIAHGIETVDDIKTAGSVEIVDGDGTADDIGTIDGIGTEDSNGTVEDGTADSIKTVDGVGIAHGIETVDDIKTAGSVEIVDGDGTADDIGTIDGIGTEDSNGTVEDGTADSIKTVDGVEIAHGIETVDDIKTAGSVEIVDGDGTADDIGTIDGIGTEDSNGTVEDGTADSIKTVDGVGIAHGIETVDDIKTAGSVEIVDGDDTADDIGTIDGIGTEDSNGTVEDGTADSIKTVDGVEIAHGIETVDDIKTAGSVEIVDGDGTADSIKTVDGVGIAHGIETVDDIKTAGSVEIVDGDGTADDIGTIDGIGTEDSNGTVEDGTADSIKTVDGVGIAHGIETVDDIKTAGSVEIVDGDGTADDIGTIDGIGTEDSNGTVEDGTADSIKTVDGVGIAHGIETVDDIKTAGSVEIVDGDGTADDIGTIDGIGTEDSNDGTADSIKTVDGVGIAHGIETVDDIKTAGSVEIVDGDDTADDIGTIDGIGTVEGNLSSPENARTLSKVEINFLRIVNLLTTISPSAVRVYFDKQIPPNELKTFVDLEENNQILENLQKRRIITPVQWKLLFPSDGTDPSSSTFDVTLMVAILRNLKGMTVYDGSPSTYKNVTDSMAVSSIKYYRNHIVHKSTGQLSDNEFNIIFDKIVEAIEKLSPSMKSKCDLLRIRELDRLFIEVCQEFINKEKEYDEIRKEQTAIQADHKLLQKEHATLQADNLALKKKQEHLASQLMFIESKQDKIKLWEEEDKTFVKTKNVDSIIKVLQRENCVTVFGKSGMGKSATIHHIALLYQNTYGYTITPCKSPVDIKQVSDKHQIFVIDDMGGKYKIRQKEIEEWLDLYLLDFDDKFIVSCQSEIFRHPKFQILEQFVEYSFELSYCKEDHLEIAAKYLTSEDIEQLNDVIDISPITPLLFYLFSRNDSNSNLSEFIDIPFKIYTKEWHHLAQLNATQYCVLFLCMLYNGCIDLSSLLSEFENKEKRLKLKYIFEQCGIERGTCSRKIITQLDCLRGSYVELKNERYVLIHDALLDFLCCYFGERFPEIVIKYADKDIIFERIQLKSISACHEKYTIEISEEFEREYFQRISKEILNGNIMEALDSPQMQYEQYQVKMVHILQQLDKQKFKDLMMITTNDCTILNPLFLTCSRGYDPIVSLFIDAGANINQRNSCNHTPLMTASFNGQQKTVLLLIENGASVDRCDFDGWTALKYACGKGFIDIVQLLLNNRASIVDVYSNYQSPLETAKLYGHKEIMDLLLSNGADKITFPTRPKSERQYQRKCTETVMSAKGKQIRHCKNHYDSQMRHMAKKKKSKYHELV